MSEKIPTDGGPAFPLSVGVSSVGDVYHSGEIEGATGMFLRDWFAGQALAGLQANTEFTEEPDAKLAEWAYQIADAMLEARSKTQGAG